MAREAKFTFIPASQLEKKEVGEKHTATVIAKHTRLTFSLGYIRDNSLENTFIKLFADPKKRAIGWRVVRDYNPAAQLKEFKKVNIYKTPKGSKIHAGIGIAEIINAFSIKKDKAFKKLPIKRYKDSLIDEDIHYIELA